jgi:hypothetical protein
VEVILNHVNSNVRGSGQREARRRRMCKRLKLGGGQLTICTFRVVAKVKV